MRSSPLLAGASLIASLSAVSAETVHGVVVFTRHGDRTTKHYGGQALTNLGKEQNFRVGSDYRSRYLSSESPHQILGISEYSYVSSQVYATAPNQGILFNTATAFLQGLYPPLVDLNVQVASQTLNNGSRVTSPLHGYQYVTLQAVDGKSPDTIWIKGDDQCPAVTTASQSFEESAEFSSQMATTRDLYRKFYPILSGVYDYTPEEMTYANAYDIFDLINVARIHNATSLAQEVSDEDLFQLRTLADSAEFGYNFNATQPARSIHAQTLTGAILTQLNNMVTSKGNLKISLLAGSYDTFLAFFGLSGLTSADPNFFGLPDYASTMAFELFSPDTTSEFPVEDDLAVRFLFRNGTEGVLKAFPLFGTGEEALSWKAFASQMEGRAIRSTGEWCSACGSTAEFCAAYSAQSAQTEGRSSMSNVVAGVIGVLTTLGVVSVGGMVAFLVLRKRQARTPKGNIMLEKRLNIESASV